MQQTRLPRQRVLKGAKIIFNNGASVFDCAVRNISDGGAAIEIPSTEGIPGEFIIAIGGEAPRACRVAWKRSGRIGIRFT